MQRKKVSVIGSGNVGGTLAQFLAIREIGDVYFFDVVDGIPEGKALDIFEGSPHWGYDIQMEGYTVKTEDSYRNLEGFCQVSG